MTDKPNKIEAVREFEVKYDNWGNPYEIQPVGLRVQDEDGNEVPEEVKRNIISDIIG